MDWARPCCHNDSLLLLIIKIIISNRFNDSSQPHNHQQHSASCQHKMTLTTLRIIHFWIFQFFCEDYKGQSPSRAFEAFVIFAAGCSNKMMGCNIKLKPKRLQVSSAVELSRSCCDKEPADQLVLVKNIKLEKQREGLFLCLIIQEGRVGIVHFLTFHYGSPIVEEIPPTLSLHSVPPLPR